MDEQEIERVVRETYADMPIPAIRAPKPARRGGPLAGLAAVAAAIVLGIVIGVALPRLRPAPAAVPPSGPYAVLFAEGSLERFRVVDTDGRTLATMDRGSSLSVSSVTPSPDGQTVAYWRSSVTGAELLVWDVATGQTRKLFGSDSGGGGIVWAQDSRSFVTSAILERAFEAPPKSARLLRVDVDGPVATLMQLTDAFPPVPLAYDDERVAALIGVSPRDATYTLIFREGQRILVRGVGAPLTSTFANPRSQDGGTVAGNFKEFESVEPNDIRVWRIEAFDPPLARHLERGGEGALLWPGRETVLFANMSGPSVGTLKALRFGGAQRVEELGATDGIPLAIDPAGRWLLTSAPSLQAIDGEAIGGARRLPISMPMRAIGWVSSSAASRTPPPTPQPPSCERPGTSAEDVLRAFLGEIREGDVNGMTGCWSSGRFTFADASAYTRTRLLESEIEPYGSQARDTEGRAVLGFRVRAGWEFRERSPWRADGGCCERVFLVKQQDGGTWRIESSQTVSAKIPPDACAARSGLTPEKVVEVWFGLLADERAADMAFCWADAIPERDALMRGYVGTGGTARLEIGPATPTRSGAVAVRVLVDWRGGGSGAWSNGQTKWLIVRRQADGRWAIESTATALVPDAQ